MKFVAVLFLLCVLVAGAAAGLVFLPVAPSQETFVELPPGTSAQTMATTLEQHGVIRSRYAFLLLRAWKHGRLKAGEYRFADPASAAEVYRRIAQGDVYTRALTIPEGYNLFDIARAVEAAKLASGADFLTAAKQNTQLIAQWSPHATSLEGYLYPDTYLFSHTTTPVQMLQAMVKRFNVQAARLGLQPAAASCTGECRPAADVVTLASLVEKEVHFDNERTMAAGVFVNRLRQGMPLQTDPTVIYAAMLSGRWRGTIYRSDLQFDSPYNTYAHKGLPPGPICSPGAAALRAAMHPEVTDNLYFVADRTGHTQFSQTLAEHAQQVQSYRAAVPAQP
ncbi:endolytic transglycosylase MltG [Terriglobus aquaticus]|uniref:Endolytic murein transglycosylase n=1 Tax=Terriglobus aquaticus TaxID=940139 RepID=A0ABW9KIM1_9BACT|nr:endolytic transglycosylase MltG [Terriglobus aquaticus]